MLRSGETHVWGDLEWRLLAAPGHRMGALVFYNAEHRVLISGDALWENGYGFVMPAALDPDALPAARDTLDMIAGLDVRYVIPGHGEPFADAAAALDRAYRRTEAFEADQVRVARHALKGLLAFTLLHRRRMALADLPAYVERVGIYRDINQAALRLAPVDLATMLVAELQKAGAARIEDGWLMPGPMMRADRRLPVPVRHGGRPSRHRRGITRRDACLTWMRCASDADRVQSAASSGTENCPVRTSTTTQGKGMSKKSFVPIISATAVVAAFSVAVLAQDMRPDRAIKYRQGIMQAQGWQMGMLSRMAKGEIPYNKDQAVRAATFVNELVKMPWEGFVPVSDSGNTKAKPEIWKDKAKFDKSRRRCRRRRPSSSRPRIPATSRSFGPPSAPSARRATTATTTSRANSRIEPRARRRCCALAASQDRTQSRFTTHHIDAASAASRTTARVVDEAALAAFATRAGSCFTPVTIGQIRLSPRTARYPITARMCRLASPATSHQPRR